MQRIDFYPTENNMDSHSLNSHYYSRTNLCTADTSFYEQESFGMRVAEEKESDSGKTYEKVTATIE